MYGLYEKTKYVTSLLSCWIIMLNIRKEKGGKDFSHMLSQHKSATCFHHETYLDHLCHLIDKQSSMK